MTSPAVAGAGELVGPYRVLKAIGAGGSARIDLARIDRAYGFQRHVVIKRPLEHLRGSAAVAASLQREARLGGRLRHPNLVAILDAGVHDGYDYLALEYVHGAVLRTLMQVDAPGRVRELPLEAALAIVAEVARGLHAAHELTDEHRAPLGLVHRDVSPGNILLGLDGSVKLADFGLAKETRITTLSGSMHGTVTYMAPEQCQGHAYDRRADVFSLGVILYELATGTRLFWADNDVASLHRVLSGTVPRPRKIKPELAGALEDIILAAIAHEPEHRIPTALALAEAIERYAATVGEAIGARWIARAVTRAIGRRSEPWLPVAPAANRAATVEPSLIELLAAAPEEPLPAAFGDQAGPDESDFTLPRAATSLPARLAAASRRPRRRIAGAIVTLGLVGAGAITALVLAGGAPPEPTAHAAQPLGAAAPLQATPPQAQLPPAPAQPSTTAAPPSELPPTSNATPPRPRPRPRPRNATAPPATPKQRARPPAAEPPLPVAGRGRSVEWSPALLLPTDGSQAKGSP